MAKYDGVQNISIAFTRSKCDARLLYPLCNALCKDNSTHCCQHMLFLALHNLLRKCASTVLNQFQTAWSTRNTTTGNLYFVKLCQEERTWYADINSISVNPILVTSVHPYNKSFTAQEYQDFCFTSNRPVLTELKSGQEKNGLINSCTLNNKLETIVPFLQTCQALKWTYA